MSIKEILAYAAMTLGLIFIITPLFLAITGFKPTFLGMPNFDIIMYISLVAFGLIVLWAGVHDYNELKKQ